MNHRRLYLAAAIIVAAALGSFFFSVPRAESPAEPLVETEQQSTTTPEVTIGKDETEDGVRTIAGTVLAEQLCAKVEAVATADTETPALRLALRVVEEPVCLRVKTKIEFSTSVETGERQLPLVVTVHDQPVTPLYE